jgi:hypothetical protein
MLIVHVKFLSVNSVDSEEEEERNSAAESAVVFLAF